MKVSRADGHTILPTADIALAIHIPSHSHHGAVGFQAYRVAPSRTERLTVGNFLPQCKAPLSGIPVISRGIKCRSRAIAVSARKQFFRRGVGSQVGGFFPLFRAVLVVFQGCKGSDCFRIVSLFHQGNRRLIPQLQNGGPVRIAVQGFQQGKGLCIVSLFHQRNRGFVLPLQNPGFAVGNPLGAVFIALQCFKSRNGFLVLPRFHMPDGGFVIQIGTDDGLPQQSERNQGAHHRRANGQE